MNRGFVRRFAVFAVELIFATHFASAADVKLGVQGGLSIPNIRGSADDLFSRGFTSRLGPFFGLMVETGLGPRFSLVAELNDSSQGGLRKGLQPITMELPPDLPVPPGTILYADFRNETILDYIEVPVMGRWAGGGRLRFFLNAGPYVGFLVRAKAVTSGTSALYLDEAGTTPVVIPPSTDPLIVDLGAKTDVKDSLKTVNVGVAGGGGVIYPLGPGDLILEARFELGLTTIQKDVATSGESRTGAVIVSLGYSFPLGRHR
jgi:hypothetical protein